MDFPENEKNIDDYIKNNPDSLLEKRSREVTIHGKTEYFQGYRLPRKLVFYNPQNGRYASTYPNLLRKNGGKELDPSDEHDSNMIKDHLLSIDTIDNARTIASLKKNGQEKLGIITKDGILIDGNRRMACLSECYETTKDQKFNFIDVARLNRTISDSDRYDCEVKVSMGMDSKVDYGPIDKLIKLQNGINMKKTPQELANLMYGMSEKDVERDLEKLDRMKTYLKIYYGDDEDFTPLQGIDVHFSELYEIISAKAYDDLDDEVKEAIEKVSFRLIRGAKTEGLDEFGSRRLRKIKHAVVEGMDASLNILVDVSDNMKPYDPDVDEKDESPTKTGYVEFEDKVRAQDNQERVILLINSILANLEVLKTGDPRLKEEDSKTKITRIKKFVDKLVSDVGV